MNDKIKYSYAYDENNNIVNISDTSKHQRAEKKYYCISCGSEMTPRLGDINSHHFAHKNTQENCSGETYLHKLAKKLIRENFIKTSSFILTLLQKELCSQKYNCKLFDENICYNCNYRPFNLKEFYDTCEEEKQICNFIADLLFCNSNKKGRDPILIEIKVSHECTLEKINSGLRIIEIPIKTENDIIELMKNNTLNYNNEYKYYNFRDKTSEKSLEKKKIKRFSIFDNGYIKIEGEKCSCKGKKHPNSTLELNIDNHFSSDCEYREYGIAYALKTDNNITFLNHCAYCKFGIPIEYPFLKKLYPPIKCSSLKITNINPSTAKCCKYYTIDKSKFETLFPKLQNIMIEEIK